MFNEQQTKLRETDSVKIARRWAASSYIYGADSKQRTPNPEVHPEICQRENGTYCDVEGRTLPLDRVPEYIREQGRPPKTTTPVGGEVDLAAAMTSAATPADPKDRPAKRGPGRPRKVK